MKRNYHGQMSESFIVGILLCLAGGFQDAYTYNFRDKVFANAQTGNIVLMGQNLAMGEWGTALRYLLPLLAFVGGIWLAQTIRYRCRRRQRTMLHWRQVVLAIEILILFAVGLFPTVKEWNVAANVLVSFSCAMQVDSFRKIRGSGIASTMCIGNLRSATDLLCAYKETGDKQMRQKGLWYYGFILVFAVGAAAGGILSPRWGEKAIWLCCVTLLLAFVIMFIEEEQEEDSSGRKEGFWEELKDIENQLEQALNRNKKG